MRTYDQASVADFYNFPMNGGDEVTVHFGEGTNTSTDIYLLGRVAKYVSVRPDTGADCQITKINGRTLSSPLPVPSDNYRREIICTSITIVCNTALTVKIYAEG